MSKVICRRTLKFPKIAFYGKRKINLCTIDIELRECGGEDTFRIVNGIREYTGEKTPTYLELAICGDVWNNLQTDVICGGQCLDTMHSHGLLKPFKANNGVTFGEILHLWENYHLNGMHAGTPEQEAIVKEAFKNERYDYTKACQILEERGMLTVEWEGKPYKYGHAWLHYELPEEVVARVKEICGAS